MIQLDLCEEVLYCVMPPPAEQLLSVHCFSPFMFFESPLCIGHVKCYQIEIIIFALCKQQ